MKRFLLSAAVLLAAFVSVTAQPRPRCEEGWRDRFRSEKVAFLTSEMDITPAEAEKFWPVYNQLQDERNAAQKEVMDAYRELETAVAEGKTGKKMESALDRYRDAVKKRHEISDTACERLKKVLPAEMVAKYDVSEEKFRREQIHRLHRNDHCGPERPAPAR